MRNPAAQHFGFAPSTVMQVSKSSQYCYASSAQPHGLLVLCEVALGKQRRFLQADYEAAKKCKKDGEHAIN